MILAAQKVGSAVITLCPTAGTTTSLPCGNIAATAAALAAGVRMSMPPATASTGTFGSGPAASPTCPLGSGHPRQKLALPTWYAQLPKGPNVPDWSAATAVWSVAGRPATGALAAHGSGPSLQMVAAKRPKLRSIAWVDWAARTRSVTRPSGLRLPLRAAWTTDGSIAARPPLRSASTRSETSSTPLTRTFFVVPSARLTGTRTGVPPSLFATVTTSATKSSSRSCKRFPRSTGRAPSEARAR